MTGERARLTALMVELREAYAEARRHWQDEVAQHFDRRYWQDIDRSTQNMLEELEYFEETLTVAEDAIRRLDA